MHNKTLLSAASLFCLYLVSPLSAARVSGLETASGDSYYYTDHFEITVNQPVAEVWPHVVEMGQWMPWMAGDDAESPIVAEGDRVHLYGDSYIEVVKVIPRKMILLANLPVDEKAEQSQGVAMVSVAEDDGKTLNGRPGKPPISLNNGKRHSKTISSPD